MFEQQQARRFKQTPQGRVHLLSFAVALATGSVILGGCSQFEPKVSTSEGHIAAPAQPPSTAAQIPAPARVAPLVPPPTAQVKPQTYSVVVHEVPVKELLLALARDTKRNIDIHPGLNGLVSLNAINETLEAILERISKQVDLRYSIENSAILITPDTPITKTYHIDYVNMTRNTSSTISVSGQISPANSQSGGQGGGGAQGGSGGTSQSISSIATTSVNDFWKTLETTVRNILDAAKTQTRDARAERLALVQAEQKIRLQEAIANTAARGGTAATGPLGSVALGSSALAGSAQAASQQSSNLNLTADVVLNSVAGTLTVTATEAQHKLVQDYVTRIQRSAQRQVLIEATIVEVQLSDTYQGGVDWQKISQSAGFAFQQSTLAGNLGAAPFFALFYNQGNGRPQDIQLTVRLLQQFGNTRILSSPKIMTLNNQTALLKVVDDVVYFEVQTQAGTVSATGIVTPPTTNTTPKTVAIGVAMSVTPQINQDGRVTLTVRPSITRVTKFVNDPNPALAAAGQTNPVPQIQTREMESVLQALDGQTIVLGGLMQDDAQFSRNQLPGADAVGAVGDLFRFRNEKVSKTELLIFLRPIVVTTPSVQSDELKFFQRFLPQVESNVAPSSKPTP